MHNIEITHKNESLSLFHINARSVNKNFFECTPTETSAGCTLLYFGNHLSYKCRNDLNTYKKVN